MLEAADKVKAELADGRASACTSTSATASSPAPSTTSGRRAGFRCAWRSGRAIWPAARSCWPGARGGKEAVPLDGIGCARCRRSTRCSTTCSRGARRREQTASAHPESKQAFMDLCEDGGGFVYAGWCGDPAVRGRVKEETKATIRVIPDAEFRSPRRRRPACGRGSRPWRRRYGRRRTDLLRAIHLLLADPALLLEDAGFWRRDGKLVDGGVSLADWRARSARRRTSITRICAAAFRAWRGAARPAHRIRYAVKANGNLACCACCGNSAPAPTWCRGRAAPRAGGRIHAAAASFSAASASSPASSAAIAAGVGHINVESRRSSRCSRLADGAGRGGASGSGSIPT